MKKRALRTVVIAIEVVAIAIALVAAVLIFTYWRLGEGPISLGLFRPSVEFAIEQRLPKDYSATLKKIELARAESRGAYVLRLADATVLDADGQIAASAPEMLVTFDVGDFISGEFGPKSFAANSATFRIVRRENLNVDIPIVKRQQKKSRSSRISKLLDGGLLKSAFESAELSNAEITFLDIASSRAWSTKNAQVYLTRNDRGLVARAHGMIDMDGLDAGIDANADYEESSGVINVAIDGKNFPIGDILSTFYGDQAAILDAPVSGRAEIAFTPNGDVLSSKFDAHVGEGALVIDGARRAVTRIDWETGFDPKQNLFSVDRFSFDIDGFVGALNGEVAISFGDDIRKPERISYKLNADEITVTIPAQLPAPLPIKDIVLTGDYYLPERRMTLQTLKAQFAGLSANGGLILLNPRGGVGAPSPSMGAIADVTLDGALNPQQLLSIWPRGLATGARDWVEARLRNATIDNLKFVMDLEPGAIGDDGGMPDEAMTLSFDARNVKAFYSLEMTPLEKGSGRGVLRGNSFKLDISSASVGDVDITNGEVAFPVFIPKWEPTYYRFNAQGNANAMLAILNEPPLSLLSKVKLEPDQFDGEAKAQIEIMRPNKREVLSEEYGYKGTATFENMTIKELVGDIQFTEAHGEVNLKTRSLTVKANAALADEAPITLLWRQNFYKQDGPSDISISGVFDSSTGDLFGVASRKFLRGPVSFDAKATGDLGAFKTLDLNADFTQAALTIDALGWRKPAGDVATGELAISLDPEILTVNSLSISGDGVDVAGSLSMNRRGALQTAALHKVFFEDAADLTLVAERDATGVLGFTALGSYLNAGTLIQQILDGPSDQQSSEGGIAWGQGVSLTARIDRLGMRGGVEYRDGALDVRRDAERLQMLDFTAFGNDGKPLTVSMALTGAAEGPQRAVEAHTSEIGELMTGVFGIDSILGGEGSMRLALHPAGQPGFSGELEARNLQLVNAPLLARIFSAGSLEGLTNLLSGDGIEFDYAYGKFDYAEGVLSLDKMRATGDSVGITAEGEFGLGQNGQTNLVGAVAPIYMLNSALGNAPIIGDILVGKKGEGLLAFSYRVSGDSGNPSVFVNPLSALTPGIFRQLMQPTRVEKTDKNQAPQTFIPETEPESDPAPAD